MKKFYAKPQFVVAILYIVIAAALTYAAFMIK